MAVKAKAVRVVRHADGSRTIAGTFIPKRWNLLPETHIATTAAGKDYVSFMSIYSTYNTSNMEVFHSLLELAENGEKFTVTGFSKDKNAWGRGKSLYVSKNILPMLGNTLALRGERKATRGIRGIRAVTGVAQGKAINGEPIDVLVATADRVLTLLPLMTTAFEELAQQVKLFAKTAKKK